MIYTVTLNPAIDKTITVSHLQINEVNRIDKVRQDPGGKGINVSKMIKNLGGSSEILTVTGGHAGKLLVDMIEDTGISYKTFHCRDNTRTNTKVVDIQGQTFTDLNEPGPEVSIDVLEDLTNYLEAQLKKEDVLVLSGSAPKGVPVTIYKTLSLLGNKKEALVLLDADGDLFKEGVKGKPFLVKPNEKELSRLMGRPLEEKSALIEAALSLIEQGISVVALSLGVKGAALITKEEVTVFNALKVSVKSTVGAGDSMMGALAYKLNQTGSDLSQMAEHIKLGIASSSATIEQPGTLMGSKERVMALVTSVTNSIES